MNQFSSILIMFSLHVFLGHSIPLKCYTTSGTKCKKSDVFEKEFRRGCATPTSRCAQFFCLSNNCIPSALEKGTSHSYYWMCGTLCSSPEVSRKLKVSLSSSEYLNYQLYYKTKENKKLYKALRTASFDNYSGKNFRQTFSSFIKYFSLRKSNEKWCLQHCISQGESCPLLSEEQKLTCVANCSTFTKVQTKLKKCVGGAWKPFKRAASAIQGSAERILDNLINYQNRRIRNQNQPNLRNQTAHEKTVEQGIIKAVEKLKIRYPNYRNLQKSILEKMADKADYVGKSLSEDELTSIQVLIKRIGKSSGDTKERLIEYLSLSYLALEDRKVLETIFGHAPSEDEMIDRWVSWFKSALFDSQNAYTLDRGGIACSISGSDASCWAGTWNRIIMALNLIHPDVEIAQGDATEENILKYNQGRFTQTIPDKVKDHLLSLSLDELKNNSLGQSVRDYMNQQAQKVFAYKGGTVPIDVTEGLDFYFNEGYFEEAVEEIINIKQGTFPQK